MNKKKFLPHAYWSFPHMPFFWEEEDWVREMNEASGLSVWEDPTHIYIEAALPGLKPEEIEVTYNQGIVWVKGEKSEEKKENKKYYRHASHSFSYRVAIPGSVDESKEPEANYQDGIMQIKFAKKPDVQPKKIPVKKKSS